MKNWFSDNKLKKKTNVLSAIRSANPFIKKLSFHLVYTTSPSVSCSITLHFFFGEDRFCRLKFSLNNLADYPPLLQPVLHKLPLFCCFFFPVETKCFIKDWVKYKIPWKTYLLLHIPFVRVLYWNFRFVLYQPFDGNYNLSVQLRLAQPVEQNQTIFHFLKIGAST